MEIIGRIGRVAEGERKKDLAVKWDITDGPKAIRYYDATTCKIKVSQNYVFNANETPTLEVSTVDIPGLAAEGENADDRINPNPTAEVPKEKDPEIESSKNRK